MGFASGSVSFRRFAVVGAGQPKEIDQDLLDKLDTHALRPDETGTSQEVEYGWSGGRHILDASFSFEHNVFADAVSFGMRVDRNKVPSELKKAYQQLEEDAAAATNPSGFISKQQKRDMKEIVRGKIDDDLRSGRFRRSKLLPILWDIPSQTLYCAASGATQEQLIELFDRTFGLELQPLSAGSIALRLLETRGRRRDYEDSNPTRFVIGPDGESHRPEYPWVAKGPQPKDFLGNEFMLWLWHEAEENGGAIETDGDTNITIFIDRSLDLDCAYGQTGKDSLRGDGPSRMPEARDALRTGKLPRKTGLLLDSHGQQYQFTFNPETFGFGSTKLPEVPEADSPRVLFEERIGLLRELCKSVDAMYDAFLKTRASASWEGRTATIRKWVYQAPRMATPSAVALAQEV